MSDVRGKWPGKELVGMNFVGSAKAGSEGRRARAGRGRPGAGGDSPRRRAAARGAPGLGRPTAARRRSGVGTPAPPPCPRPRPTPAAWHGSKRASDCYALCFLFRAEPGGMGLAQAVSLPRGGGTLKGQRPLPAASLSPSPLTPLPSRALDPFPGGDGRLKLGSRGRARRPARRWRGPRGREPRAEGTRRAGSQASNGARRLGRARLFARRAVAVVRRKPGESQEDEDKEEKERVAGAYWAPGASSQDNALLPVLTKIFVNGAP